MMRYILLQDCIQRGFPYIHAVLSSTEPAPVYEQDESGMSELNKVLLLMRNDDYYPTFFEKSSYLISSIAGSQYFQNGNKRLAVVVLLLLLIENRVQIINAEFSVFSALLKRYFPAANIERNQSIQDPHALFLYNLAIVLGDRSVQGGIGFEELREKVANIFRQIYQIELD